MARELQPEDIIESLEKRKLAPFYMFYGSNEFLLEKTLSKIKDSYIPEDARDFNQQVCYGGESSPSEIINMARTLPFMTSCRLIIVRRTEDFSTEQLNLFVPYLKGPVDSTCLIFVSLKTDFKKTFYKSLRDSGFAVQFQELKDSQVVPWIIRTAKEMEMNMDHKTGLYLQGLVGNRLQDLYSELTKLRLSYGPVAVGEKDVSDLAIHSRMYTVFELMDEFSVKNMEGALSILSRFLEEEDKRSGPIQLIGMFNRQIGLLMKAKDLTGRGETGKASSVLGIPHSLAQKCLNQAKCWSVSELERGITSLFDADRLLKSGSRPKQVLENLILNMCG
jgi:DNA polymerase III subunit delta